MASEEEVVCVDFWCNEFGMRVRIALREKRVGFGFVEEDLRVRERSQLVRRMNPVYRSIPILIHRGRPICGSLNIVEYVDNAWADGARLLPADPLERASARFWADFVDQKVFSAQHRFFTSRGEEKEAAKAELMDHLRRLEGVLGEKAFFGGGGGEFGFLDVALVPFSSMFYGYEQHGGVDMEAECPRLMRWVRRCAESSGGSRILLKDLEDSEACNEWGSLTVRTGFNRQANKRQANRQAAAEPTGAFRWVPPPQGMPGPTRHTLWLRPWRRGRACGACCPRGRTCTTCTRSSTASSERASEQRPIELAAALRV